jgi:hypothetical protein
MESKKIMARISRHHHALERALRSAPDLDHIVDSDEMIGLSRRHKDTKKSSRPERRRPRRHQDLIAMTLRQLRQTQCIKIQGQFVLTPNSKACLRQLNINN